MVTNTPVKPCPLLNLYLADGNRHLAQKTISFNGVQFSKRVSGFGSIDKSIPYPSGLIHSSDATIELPDVDGTIRAWFDNYSPFRRMGEVIFEFEQNADVDEGDLELPITNFEETSEPLTEPVWKPIFTGEIYDFDFPPGKAVIKLASITNSWLDRPIPMLATRDNFPNLPNDIEAKFANIIFGRVESDTNISLADRQGVIPCPFVDTNLNRFLVARHTCYEIIRVYRKEPLDKVYTIVAGEDYSVIVEDMEINGIIYQMTYIQFLHKQHDGTLVSVDASGINYRWNFDINGQESGEVRNAAECVINLLYYLSLDEIRIDLFDRDWFIDTIRRCETLGYFADGCLSEQVTGGVAVSMLLSDFLMDLSHTKNGKLKIHLYDEELDADSIIPIDRTITVLNTVHSFAPEKPYNSFRYRYMRQNAPLTEYTKQSNTANWGMEDQLEYRKDQIELIGEGATPLQVASRSFKTEVELNFVRDPTLARRLMKRRMAYHTLRSYRVEFTVPGPPFLIGPSSMDLGTPIAMTHYWGVQAGGWTSKVMKIHALKYDLKTLRIDVKAIILGTISDADVVYTHLSGPVDEQVRRPQIATLINGTSTVPFGDVRPDAHPQVDINDDFPTPPASVIVTDGGHSLGFRNYLLGVPDETPGTGPIPTGTVLPFINVKWQEAPTKPRQASGYIPNFGAAMSAIVAVLIATGIKLEVGTLFPDEKPSDLTSEDINKVLFYSTDFDHLYLYTGEEGTGWRAIGWDGGMIGLFQEAPTTNGWEYADGRTGVRVSTWQGETTTITLPDCREVYLKASATYTGPTKTNAIQGDHYHNDGTLVAESHSHSIDVSSLSAGGSWAAADYQHDHTYNGSTGNESAKHIHSFGGEVSGASTIDGEGAHSHAGATFNIADFQHFHNIPEYNTGLGGGHSHTVTGSGSGITGGPTGTQDVNEDGGFSAASSDHGHSVDITVTGSTSSDGSHSHTWGGSGALTAEDAFKSDETITTVPIAISSSGAHNHNVSGDTGTDSVHHHHTYEGTTGLSTNVGTIPISVSLSGGPTSTGGSGASVDGHTGVPIAGSTNYEPDHMGLLPYRRA